MGCGQSAPDSDQDRAVQKELMEDQNTLRQVKKLLLLGTGGSGKSTFFKQLQRIHGTGFSLHERRNFRSKIYEQTISQMQLMISKCQELSGEHPELLFDGEVAESADFIYNCSVTNEVTPEIARHIQILWDSQPIKYGWDMRAKLCIVDSSEYFWNDIDRISALDYEPSDQDLILNRYMTTGMTEKTFDINGHQFVVVDVGGQRSERRKWIHFFDGVTAVCFVMSLSGFDEVLFEDSSKNVMIESIEVLDQTWNSHWFGDTAFIVFLNKQDLLEHKLGEGGSIKTCFPEFEHGSDYEATVDFIRDRVLAINTGDNQTRQMYAHITTATDPDNVERVFNDVQHIVINTSLSKNFLT